ncbi:serine-rich coiled-coil domain-containing protein 1 isoform X2 [Bombina bombina]|uniref:serine-rich coiled-coil domain-containing protein 1 isoform X2 n=1 Tax=Bombina bombina TaxID=8345 RepID=UPI00235A51A7|nr:serine-rich coiled-coil domain-containing protein 1 isoform X2 [Bombina bombina]
MGDLGERRSTLVSRLPIFRRSVGRRQDSLPSSPSSSNTVGLHSSSPSSTNSSSGSTGKRKSIFRTPSLNFRHRKDKDQQFEPTIQTSTVSNGAQSPHNIQNQELKEQSKAKGRSSIGLPGSCRRKITRSHTEDFEKRKGNSKYVFSNCLGKNDGDDSGFVEEQRKPSIKHSTRKLLPRSFSSHYRFSKTVSQCQSPSLPHNSQCSQQCIDNESSDVRPVLSSTAEITEDTEHSLPSPLVSTDHTTAPQTPSDFIFMDDSTSEADSLPNSINQPTHFCHTVSTSETFYTPKMAATQRGKSSESEQKSTQCGDTPIRNRRLETSMDRPGSNLSLSCTTSYQSKALLPISELTTNDVNGIEKDVAEHHIHTPAFHSLSAENFTNKCEPAVDQCEVTPARLKSHRSVSESKSIYSSEPQSSFMQYGYTRVNHASSPYRDGKYTERRLRSSSEGTAGSSRMAFKPKEGNMDESNSLRKQRTNSTSSKMNSMDVLNNLGSCELDEDDLMLDLEFTEEQHLRRVCREDSYQSIVSCSAVVLSHVEQTETIKTKEEERKMTETAKKNLFLHLSKESDQEDVKSPCVCQVPSSPSVEWPFAQEESTGLESLPFRLMIQDCTSVKTLLLKMKRTLQESADMSPASSTNSLPLSPMTERNFPFKDIMKDECSMLKLQLKERDELILQLQEELKKAQSLQLPNISTQDKGTQTEFASHDVQKNSTSTEGSIYKAIRPVHCYQHYQFKTNIWTQDALH